MVKNAYLIVSDLHFNYKNLRSRISYRNEIMHVCNEIIKIADSYTQRGYNIILLLLGDVFNRSYNDIFAACNDNNFFYSWALRYGKIYSVLGNHELTYYSANPFYTLVSSIESARIRRIMNKVWTPVGSTGVINLVDRLDDGDVSFYFNHYSTGIETPNTGRVNIGLFHQDIISGEIMQACENRTGISTFAHAIDIEHSGLLSGYDYCFFGHMHTVYGTFKTEDGIILCYLASLGRTNIKEINNNFLERNIPVIRVDDGKFAGADDNKIMLLSYEDSVKESEVIKNEAEYKASVERKIAKTSVSFCDDPVKNVLADLSANSLATNIFNGLLDADIDNYGKELMSSITEALKTSI